jgi:hypothetical protein
LRNNEHQKLESINNLIEKAELKNIDVQSKNLNSEEFLNLVLQNPASKEMISSLIRFFILKDIFEVYHKNIALYSTDIKTDFNELQLGSVEQITDNIKGHTQYRFPTKLMTTSTAITLGLTTLTWITFLIITFIGDVDIFMFVMLLPISCIGFIMIPMVILMILFPKRFRSKYKDINSLEDLVLTLYVYNLNAFIENNHLKLKIEIEKYKNSN